MYKETWLNRKWRPTMAWVYMAICILDFAVFPILWSAIQYNLGQQLTQWQPITLQGGGLVHMAFGAIVGVTAWWRSKEKINNVMNLEKPNE